MQAVDGIDHEAPREAPANFVELCKDGVRKRIWGRRKSAKKNRKKENMEAEMGERKKGGVLWLEERERNDMKVLNDENWFL